ncbi:MAG: FecR domain-containing protein [Planctomycetes bacterium]|nr:FecR domain-containing protein [Planctomycetota bacterium]
MAVGAAAALLLAASAWLLMGGAGPALESGQLLADGQPSSAPREEQRLEAVGGPAVLRLGDGSRVELAEESVARLKAPTEGLRQLVALDEGEGRFKVTHGGGQFRVETPAGHITVLGTEFTVRVPKKRKGAALQDADAQAFCVTVHAGRVQLVHEGGAILLVAGQSFTAGGGVQVAQQEPLKRPAGAAPAPNPAHEERPLKAEALEITGILRAAVGDGPGAVPEFITLTTADALVYKLEVNAAATALARDFDGQEVTVSGTLRAVDGVDWFTIGEAAGAGEELHSGGPDSPQGAEGKDDRLKRRPLAKPGELDKKQKPRPERKPAGKDPAEPAE